MGQTKTTVTAQEGVSLPGICSVVQDAIICPPVITVTIQERVNLPGI